MTIPLHDICRQFLITLLIVFFFASTLSESGFLPKYTQRNGANSAANLITPRMIPKKNDNAVFQGAVSSQVNVNLLYSREPAPMGITDYGIGSNGSYQYSTNSFLGVVYIRSLSTRTATGDTEMSFQLNANLQFTNGNRQYAYWIQNVASFDTSTSLILFVNNIWNSTVHSANMAGSSISGNGIVANFRQGSLYFYAAGPSSPGNSVHLTYPATVYLQVNASTNSFGQPVVSFAYNDGVWLGNLRQSDVHFR